jgi:dihydrofolate synthase/folylpolyglutamate synthase
MTFLQTTTYLYSLLADYQTQGSSAYKPGLDNIQTLCAALGEPHKRFLSVHVAGTNGKGSTASMIAAILQCAGFRTGLYTSPHLTSFCERIKIDGKEISEQPVTLFVDKNHALIDKIRPSFFELTTAMAFWWFAQQNVDIAVMEAGLGGRLDSTNVILPKVSVITKIALDHCSILGDTLEKIAIEKAGIIKPHTPVVIGKRQPQTYKVFEQTAQTMAAPIVFADDIYQIAGSATQNGVLSTSIKKRGNDNLYTYSTDLLGSWQSENLCTAMAAVDILRQDIDISQDAIRNGLRGAGKITGLRGRWEVLQYAPMVVTDIAHNADGLAYTMAQIREYAYDRLHIVFGIAADKDLDAILPLLPRGALYYFTQAPQPRAMSATMLCRRCSDTGLRGQTFASVKDAIKAAMQNATAADFIYIGGSAMVTAEAMGCGDVGCLK